MAFVIQNSNTVKYKITTFHWCLHPTVKFENFFNNFICFIINFDFYVIFFLNALSSSSSFGEMKLLEIINWIFPISYFLKLFMMFCKDGLISLGCSLIDRVLFLLQLLSYSVYEATESYWFVIVVIFFS